MSPFDTMEQQTASDCPLAPSADEDAPERAKPRGRPWVKGQSGNPAGRPSRAWQANFIAETLIARKSFELTQKLLQLALRGDRTALRMCLERIAPARRDAPVLLPLPFDGEDSNTAALVQVVASEMARGRLTPAQAATLIRTLGLAGPPAGPQAVPNEPVLPEPEVGEAEEPDQADDPELLRSAAE